MQFRTLPWHEPLQLRQSPNGDEDSEVDEDENLAPPRVSIRFPLTHTKLFMSIITEFCPVAWVSPAGPFR